MASSTVLSNLRKNTLVFNEMFESVGMELISFNYVDDGVSTHCYVEVKSKDAKRIKNDVQLKLVLLDKKNLVVMLEYEIIKAKEFNGYDTIDIMLDDVDSQIGSAKLYTCYSDVSFTDEEIKAMMDEEEDIETDLDNDDDDEI